MKTKKIYVIGLDGFNLSLFRKLEKEGVFPNLSRLMKNGIFGSLLSTIPPYTGPAWVSMFTGVNPGGHGVFGFTRRKPESYDNFVLDSSYISAAPIWDYLNAAGLSTGIFNLPFTFPPRKLEGFMVSGMLTPSPEKNFTYPPSVKDKIMEVAPAYDIDVPVNLDRDWRHPRLIEKLRNELENKRRVLLGLLDEYDPDFLMAVFIAPDRLQHLWWRWIMENKDVPTESFKDLIKQLFFKLDETIGAICGRLTERDIILVVSDHGFTSFNKTFYLNSWLAREGFLKFKDGGGTLRRFFRILNRPGLKKFIPRALVASARSRTSRQLIDWSQSKAYASSNMEEGIYINLKGREPMGQVAPGSDYEGLRDEIRSKLLNFNAAPASPAVFKKILRKEDLYRGKFLFHAPDLLLVLEKGWNMSSSIPGKKLWSDWSDFPWGVHHPQGMWGISGGGIKAGSEPVRADIKDILPTVLSLFKIPVPPEVEGKTIMEVARPVSASGEDTSVPPSPSASPSFSSSEEAEIKERLEGLGYI